MSNSPLVSVVTPNYNHGHYLDGLCAGIAAQGDHFIEHIIVDDQSTDNSVQIIKELQKKHPFIKLLRQTKNEGVVAAMNRGLGEAIGKYVVFRSADDIDEPGFHRTALELLESNPNIGLFCADIRFFSGAKEQGIVEPLSFSDTPAVFPKEEFPFLLGTRWLNGHTVMARTDLLKTCTPFLPDTAHLSDWFHFMITGFRGGFCYAPQVVVSARVSRQSFSSQSDSESEAPFTALLNALEGPYADVRKHFIESEVFHYFGERLASAFRKRDRLPEYNDLLNQFDNKLDKPQISEYGISIAIRSALRQIKSELLAYCNERPENSIWIYGTGGHSRSLIAQWEVLNLPQPSGILCSDEPSSHIIFDLPVYQIDQTPFKPGDIVVLSSKSYESHMAYRMIDYPQNKIISVWNKELNTFGAAFNNNP